MIAVLQMRCDAMRLIFRFQSDVNLVYVWDSESSDLKSGVLFEMRGATESVLLVRIVYNNTVP